jgi:hypothetical protein
MPIASGRTRFDYPIPGPHWPYVKRLEQLFKSLTKSHLSFSPLPLLESPGIYSWETINRKHHFTLQKNVTIPGWQCLYPTFILRGEYLELLDKYLILPEARRIFSELGRGMHPFNQLRYIFSLKKRMHASVQLAFHY